MGLQGERVAGGRRVARGGEGGRAVWLPYEQGVAERARWALPRDRRWCWARRGPVLGGPVLGVAAGSRGDFFSGAPDSGVYLSAVPGRGGSGRPCRGRSSQPRDRRPQLVRVERSLLIRLGKDDGLGEVVVVRVAGCRGDLGDAVRALFGNLPSRPTPTSRSRRASTARHPKDSQSTDAARDRTTPRPSGRRPQAPQALSSYARSGQE